MEAGELSGYGTSLRSYISNVQLVVADTDGMLHATSSTTQLLTFTLLVIEVKFSHSGSIVRFRPGNIQLAPRRASVKHRSTPQFAGPLAEKLVLHPSSCWPSHSRTIWLACISTRAFSQGPRALSRRYLKASRATTWNWTPFSMIRR